MKGFFRKVSSIILILCLCLGAVPFTALKSAEGAGVVPRALPDAGTYDQHQNVALSSEAGATITYSVYGRATVPDTLYAGGYILVEEDIILSVTSLAGGVTTHKDFSYTINPRVLSTYPSNGAANMSVNPTISVQFSREMNQSLLEDEDNITIKKVSNGAEVPRVNFTGTYTPGDNTLTIALSGIILDAGAAYTVSLSGIKDSNGKSLQGASEFTFTTAGGAFSTYGWVNTNLAYYQSLDVVQISGGFVQNGLEISANPLVPALQLLVINPNGVLDTTLVADTLTSGRFSSTYNVPAGAVTGTWRIRLYDNGSPRQYLGECTFTVGTVAPPTADRVTGTYYESISVNLTTTTSGASIYFTTDSHLSDASAGSSWNLYQGAITISSNATLRAVAIKGGVKSSLMTVSYNIDTILGVLLFVPDRVPGNHPTNVSVNTPISVTFGRPVLSETVANNFSLIEMTAGHVDVAGAFVTGTVVYDAVNRRATFTPNNPLKPNTHYRGILSTGIKDLNGVNISASIDDDWFFETGSGQQITVGGTVVSGNAITVNKNPVNITVTSVDASGVTINGVQATSTGGGQFFSNVTLKTGSNTITIVVTDSQAVNRTTIITVNYLNLMQPGATVTAVIPAKGKLELFDKQLAMVFPKGAYLKDAAGNVLSDQSLTFTLTQMAMPDGYPSVSEVFSIDPVTPGAFLNNQGEVTLTLTFDKYVSTSSSSTLTVLCDPDNDGVWEENLGGKVDAKKKTITVPFGYFGRYVVVNKVWNFRDYSSKGWAAAYVEYLWAKGIMKPLATAGPGNFGLVDSQGQEVPITRGEFAAIMGKALGLNKANYSAYNVFADMVMTGTAAYARDPDGIWQPIDPDDYKYVDMMARNGILSGSLDRNNDLVFNYHNYIKREEVAVILARAVGLTVETDDAKVAGAIIKMYTDSGTSINVWAQPFVLAASKGYFGGFPDKTFKGQDNFTRPQAARILYQTMQKAKLM